MYQKLSDIFEESARNENIKALVVTGNGDFYSSGNDFISNLTSPSDDPSVTMTALKLVTIFNIF